MNHYDDSNFRRDWESRYASSGGRYDDYEPAYRYGSYLAGNDRYRGRQWNDIEPDIRNEWESSHPRGTWESFKDSIRYGWESMTGQREGYQREGYSRQSGSQNYGSYDDSSSRRDWQSGSAASGGRYDDSSFRRDWESRYASSGGRYDDYEPAYRYGSYLAGNDRYRGRQWNDIEYDVRNDWEASHPRGTWERFKDSIRYGWENMTGSRDRPMQQMDTFRGDMDRERMGRPMQASSSPTRGGAHIPDDAERRSEFQHSYWSSGGRSEDLAPAYRYGADYADNDTNPNHQWRDVEARMRGDWEAYNREPGSWDRNVEAIRYGWERGRQHGRGTRSGHSLS